MVLIRFEEEEYELSSDEDSQSQDKIEHECPLCLLEIKPGNFHPCECIFQVCACCWYRIFLSDSPNCPGCRLPYSKSKALKQIRHTTVPYIEDIRCMNQIGFEILELMAFFDPKREISTTNFHHKEVSQAAISNLNYYGLIHLTDETATWCLVSSRIQLFVRRFVDTGKVLEVCKKYMAVVLKPAVDREITLDMIMAHIPHAIRVWKHVLKHDNGYFQQSSAMFFATLCDQLLELKLYQRLLKVTGYTIPLMSDHLAPNNFVLLKARADHAKALWRTDKVDEALLILYNVSEILKKYYGDAHQLCVSVANEISIVHNSRGNSEQALEISRGLYRNSFWTNGPEHPDTLSVGRNLAVFLAKYGKFENSLEIFRTVYQSQGKTFGRLYSETLTTQNAIGFVLAMAEKFEEARLVFEDLFLKHQEQDKANRNEAELLRTAISLARVLNHLNQHKEVLNVYSKQMNLLKACRPPNEREHLLTRVLDITRLKIEKGKAQLNLGQLQEAEKLFGMAYKFRLQFCGEKDASTEQSFETLKFCRKLMEQRSIEG